MVVDGPSIYGKIRISDSLGNILRMTSDGLFAKPENVVDRATFDRWAYDTADFKKYAQNILDNVQSQLQLVESYVTEESIRNEIMTQLRGKYADIDIALANYNQIVDSLNDIEDELMDYSNNSITKAYNDLQDELEANSKWDNIDDYDTTYVYEVDYYKKSEEYYYPDNNAT